VLGHSFFLTPYELEKTETRLTPENSAILLHHEKNLKYLYFPPLRALNDHSAALDSWPGIRVALS